MLAWVSNSPDLTDGLLADFRRVVRRALRDGPRGRATRCARLSTASLGRRRPLAGRGLGRGPAAGPGLVHAGPVRPLRRGTGGLGPPARDDRRPVARQHPRHRRRRRGAVRDRGQPAVPRRTPDVPGLVAGSDHYLGDMSLGHHRRHALHQRLHGGGERAGPAADVAGVRGRHRRLRRRPGRADRRGHRRPEDPALPGPGQPDDQLLPVGRRHQPAARRAGRRRQRPDQLHRRTARHRRPDRRRRASAG